MKTEYVVVVEDFRDICITEYHAEVCSLGFAVQSYEERSMLYI